MHFGLTEEQDMLQATLRRFVAEELPPQRLRERFDAGSGFDADLWRSAAEVGLPGLMVPESLGGSGLELLDLALAFEVLGEAAVPGPFLGHALATIALVRGGSEEQKQRWLPRLATGHTVGGIALAEQDGRWEPEAWTLAPRGGRLSGRKDFAEAGVHTDLLVVGLANGQLGIVERGAEGMSLESIDAVDRGRAQAHVHFDQTPFELLDSDEEGGASVVMDAARILLGADAFGVAWKLIRMTVDYARTREQFSTPIAQFQAVKHQLANMAMEAEPMRGLVWYAAYTFDHRPDQLAREATTVKAHVTDRVVQIGRDAVSLHGGIGFTWECDVHFWLKRAMHDRMWLGGPAAHRERLARLSSW